jgi:hypothetical protein
MTLLSSDIKLMESERLTDYADGGGEMTGREVVDGQVNNLFPDISRLDRVYGRVSLRKAFLAVRSENSDMYYGAHAIVSDPPDDGRVSVLLTHGGDAYEERAAAVDRLESYLVRSQELPLRLMGTQLAGQRAIVAFGSKRASVPAASDTLALITTTTGDTQYVRVQSVTSTIEEGMDNSGRPFEFQRVVLELGEALLYQFEGIAPTVTGTVPPTRMYATQVADASRYYSVSKLKSPALAGSVNLEVESIFATLTPTAQVETPLVDQLICGVGLTMVQSGNANAITLAATLTDSLDTLYAPTGLLPGSISLVAGARTFTDSDGTLVTTGDDGGFSGVIDYALGRITLTKTGAWSQAVTLTATPAAGCAEGSCSRETLITLANRAYTYTPSLSPAPKPGTLVVDFMAQGNWYRLRDNGRGVLVGSSNGVGTGTIDYVTGSVVLTLAALPDVGSSLIYWWGDGMDATRRPGTVAAENHAIEITLPHTGIDPGSVTITWPGKTATDNGAGLITGDATGVISYADGALWLKPTALPASGTVFAIAYEQAAPQPVDTVAATNVGTDQISLTVPNAPLNPGSVRLSWSVRQIVKIYRGVSRIMTLDRRAVDNGAGLLLDDKSGATLGTINYTTGACTLVAAKAYSYKSYYDKPNGEIAHVHLDATQERPATVMVRFKVAGAETLAAQTYNASAPALRVDLTPTTAESVAPGSLWFVLGGEEYFDVAGSLYKNRNATTGAGTLCGSIDYVEGRCTIESYPAVNTPSVVIKALVTRDGGRPLSTAVFRTPAAPVRDGSLSLRASLSDGTLLTAQAADDGTLAASGIAGTIDTTTGVARINFGSLVTAAGHENEPWYDPDLVVNGQIWEPVGILPETALYNCVTVGSLPLDAALLGINPVRLPLDGRVPVLRAGDIAVVHHTDDEVMPNNLIAGQTVTLSRGSLALVELRDQNGQVIPETQYTTDLEAGTVTMATPLDLTGFTQPLIAAHRIEDMILLAEAQINGALRAVAPLAHDFPALETQVSGALIFGDLSGRLVRSFTQKTWGNIWADNRSGDDSLAHFDGLNYPIQTSNLGCIAQRWCIKFTGATTFDVIGETLGIIASGNTQSDCAPINPSSDPANPKPYFVIPWQGWGSGWVANNALRFDTSAANAGMWVVRTTLQGPVEEPTDSLTLQLRGDAN